ncbi:hypothetical protein ACEN88_18725 [Massilia sp. CT11-108]|jgi:hypothetical protein|uniref:hypothetical protein n=1 Tax=Massilia sp. CT11-108 TaxID=3393900 RepID=UPI0039A6A9FF
MLKLDALSRIACQKHLDLLRVRFDIGMTTGLASLAITDPIDKGLLNFLENMLDGILIGSPSRLSRIARLVQGRFPAFSAYAARTQKGNATIDLIHKNTLAVIESCFDYDKFSEKRTDWCAYELVSAHNLRICPYCHAHHINYYVDPDATTVARKYRIRPPLDHFLPKSTYPYLAVSLYNLVPSCPQCNSSIKSAADPLTLGLPSPHDHTSSVSIRFSAKGSIPSLFRGTVEEIKLHVTGVGIPSAALVDAFLLQERYQWYRHEIKDLIEKYEAYRNIPKELHEIVPMERFVLGCAATEVDKRLIGRCLNDIYTELKDDELA